MVPTVLGPRHFSGYGCRGRCSTPCADFRQVALLRAASGQFNGGHCSRSPGDPSPRPPEGLALALLFLPVRLALLIQPEPRTNFLQLMLEKLVRRRECFLLPPDRLIELTGLGVGSGQGLQTIRIFPRG